MAKTSIAAQGQIWYVKPDVDDNIRTNRMKKIRPWIIISPDEINFSTSGYIGLPLTHSYNNDEFKIEVDCPTKPGKAFSKSWIITYKPRVIDEEDLISYLGVADNSIVSECVKRLNDYLCGNINKSINTNTDDEIFNIGDIFINAFDSLKDCEFPMETALPLPIESSPRYDVRTVLLGNNTNIAEKEVEEISEFLKLYPSCKYYDKYKHLTSSLQVEVYLKMYEKDKKNFQKYFSISSKSTKTLYNELNKYYEYLVNKLFEANL